MSDLRTRILIDLGGNLEQRAQRYSGVLDRFSKTGQRSLGALSRSAQAASHGLDRIGNRYTAVLTGAAGLGTAKVVMDLEDRFVRLGIQANADAGAIDHLKEKIYQAARAPEIRLDPGEITGAIEEIIEKTGDLKFAEQNIHNIGLAISATGAAGKDIGGIMSEFQKMGIIDPKQVLEALDTLNVQGKEGAFTLQNLANLGPRVVTAYTATGRGGVQAIREMGAALQVIRQGTGSSEMAATAFEALMRTMADAAKVKQLYKGGIKVFDEKEMAAGKEVLRPINELMVEIVTKTKGRQTLLSKVFDAEAIRAFNAAASEFKRTGSVELLDKFMDVHSDGSTTIQDSARAAQTANRSLRTLYVAWEQFADSKLTKPIQDMAGILNSLDQETVDRWLKLGTGLALSLGGMVIANQAIKFGRSAWGMGRWILTGGKGGKEGAGGLGGAAGGFGDAVPVYVVNGPSSIWPGSGGGPAGSTAVAVASRFAWAGPLIPIVGTAIAVEASQAAGKALARAEAQGSSSKKLLALRGRQMVMGGGQDSFQVRTIDQELTRRLYGKTLTPSHPQEQPLRGEVVVKVRAERGTEARTDMVRSSHGRGLDLQAETEVGKASGGVW
ncbi:MAG: phage tail tape measure protein [Desulfobulbia bacterium]